MATKKEASDLLLASVARKDWTQALSAVSDATLAARDAALDLIFETHRVGPVFLPINPSPLSILSGAAIAPTHLAASAKKSAAAKGSSAKSAPAASGVGAPAAGQMSLDFESASAPLAAPTFLPPRAGEEPWLEMARLAAALIKSLGDKAARRDAYAFLVGSPDNRRRGGAVYERNVRVAAWVAEEGGMIRPTPWEMQRLAWTGVSPEACRSLLLAFSASNGFNEAFYGGRIAVVLAGSGHAVAAIDLLAAQETIGRREFNGKPGAPDYRRGEFISAICRAGMAGLTAPGAWKDEIKMAASSGFDVSPNLLGGIAHAHATLPTVSKPDSASQLSGPLSLSQLQSLLDDLEWARRSFSLGSSELTAFFGEIVARNRLSLDPRAKLHMARWATEHGAIPGAEEWANAAENDPSILRHCVESNQPWPNPSGTLAAAARSALATSGLQPESLLYLLNLRKWSAEERAESLVSAASNDKLRYEKISLLLQGGGFSPDHFSAAMQEVCKEENGVRLKGGFPYSNPKEWLELGAQPAGPHGDGEPLRQALMHRNWEAAKIVADAGGWGVRAEAWLLTPRKKDAPLLKPWIEEARAMRDAKSLRQTISSVKKDQVAEAAKAQRARQKEEKALAKSGAAIPEPIELAPLPAKKSTRRL